MWYHANQTAQQTDFQVKTATDIDEKLMREAIAEATLGEGGTRPNPPGGAVLAKDGAIVARGHHRRAGSDHAEVDCLKKAGAAARGATLYVSLEPCSTAGRVGPCTSAIVEAGVSRVVYAASDANPANSGRAAAVLESAGIDVVGGVLAQEALPALEPFFTLVRTGRPFVTLKMAQSLDGAIADHAGVAKWITGAEARAEVGRLRRRADAVMVGAGTITADDPSLLRPSEPESGLPGMRCAVDARGAIPGTAKIFTDGLASRTIIATNSALATSQIGKWAATGAAVWDLPLAFPPSTGGGSSAAAPRAAIDLRALLEKFGREGYMHVLCEGGAALASALVSEGLVDELHLFVAPAVFGRPSLGVFGSFPHDLPTAPRFNIISVQRFGDDIRLVLRPKSHPLRCSPCLPV